MIRSSFTAGNAGISDSALRWGTARGAWVRAAHGVYLQGPEPPTEMQRAIALVDACGGVASGTLAGRLHGLDSVYLKPPYVTVPRANRCERREVRRYELSPLVIVEVNGVKCTNGLQTLVNLAAVFDDVRWEQMLESALRLRIMTIAGLETEVATLGAKRQKGVTLIRRVLALRPPEAPPTESLLETLAVQLIRDNPCLPEPVRQVEVLDRWGQFVARVDLAWPTAGVFIELDGQHHLDQPVHDARRETAVVAATGWLPARFTWHEITRAPKSTLRRLFEIHQRAVGSHVSGGVSNVIWVGKGRICDDKPAGSTAEAARKFEAG